MSDDEPSNRPAKKDATLFPFGFGIQRIDDSILVIDFLDADTDDTSGRVISSIAMPRRRAELLARAILEIDDEVEQSVQN
ncbi:hypothetical protein JZX87_13820 [Agrobacterium sp. Ap1]|uniref:hypothetical protein n=1 Tax=Agrobacterium sp. Ap1 TaxID=2815337 RepID=UPI001A8F0527|nr:hypothetical protein [Agrobacterium sp. Ap1]MBO0142240.1 hypothetical protein [Agrobacterium sp. Ap1]